MDISNRNTWLTDNWWQSNKPNFTTSNCMINNNKSSILKTCFTLWTNSKCCKCTVSKIKMKLMKMILRVNMTAFKMLELSRRSEVWRDKTLHQRLHCKKLKISNITAEARDNISKMTNSKFSFTIKIMSCKPIMVRKLKEPHTLDLGKMEGHNLKCHRTGWIWTINKPLTVKNHH